ncbi:MAG: enoyl-CoA hydratase/isomerase family protein [Myxococcales bacterium]|nr:enoyl-CoA hydratase/isomerase family protein [Myxococcales bacterium]MCB9577582.1 enoyl-CoA hydratase/isomerase family protein [Polyangiaceae bacterium]
MSSIEVEVGRISRIVLNRPDKHNAMTEEMGRLIADAVERINAHDAARVVLISGAGRAFCAGGDFSLIEDSSKRAAEENQRNMVAFYGTFLSVLRLRVPSVAVIHGAAVGAGLCLALAADVRLAAREAKLGANFVRVGLHPGMGSSVLLPHVVGAARARELILTGKLVSGEEAERFGLVSRALPKDELDAAAAECAEQIATAAPIAVAQAKATLSAGLLSELSAALHREAANQAIDFGTEDLKEAIAAFRAGRPPSFAGR